ncbi:UNVERIFIED_ORG: hypothetical protein QE434_001009 [Rhizobium sp. SORGH_AS 755]|nr:hypothetical protein [Rhizobium sp. SORGH_AS_0755]
MYFGWLLSLEAHCCWAPWSFMSCCVSAGYTVGSEIMIDGGMGTL